MFSISFWKSWPLVYQRLLLVIGVVFVSALITSLYSFVRSPEPVFTWQQLQELRQDEIPVRSFDVGGFELTIPTDNYIIFERWAPNPLEVNAAATDWYLLFFAAALTLLLAIVTTLPRFWFFIGAGVAVFMIPTFQLETLQVFGMQNKIPSALLIVMVLGVALYYQFGNKNASFLQRVIAFGLISMLVGLVLLKFSYVPQSLRYFGVNTLPSSIVLLLIFVIMVAHEIMGAFVTLVGKGMRNSKSLRHYLLISGIYLINLWMAYWTRIGWIDWGFTIYPVVVLFISGTLAIWGIRQRQPQYENIVDSDPFAVYFIMGLGSLAFATLGYFYSTANDTALLAVNDLILYAHIGYSMMFLTYLASNFLGMLAKNYPVYKVLYKPTVMPYFSYRLAGLIFTLTFVFYNGWMGPMNRLTSGYYTALGDLFSTENNQALSLGYYKRAWIYSPFNQHASTALAGIEASRGHSLKAKEYLSSANSYGPTEFTLLNEANASRATGNSLDEVYALQRSRSALPASGVIKNNLGLAHSRLGMVDSAYIYFSQAIADPQARASAELNLLGLMAANNLDANPDSVYRLIQPLKSRVAGNALAFANRKGRMIETSLEIPSDSVLDVYAATHIGNYITNHLAKMDTALLSRCIALALSKRNESVRDIVLVPAAAACYSTGQVNRAFQMLQNIIFTGSSQGKHNTTLALWSLDQGKPMTAFSHLEYALNQSSDRPSLANALTLAELGRLDEAVVAWDTLGKTKDPAVHSMAESMKRVLAGPVSWYNDFSEQEKYRYLRYRVSLEDSIQFGILLAQINDEDLKAKAILDRSKRYFDMDEAMKAARLFQGLQGLRLTDQQVFAEVKYFELHLLAAANQWPKFQEQVSRGILFGPYRETERIYYDAMQLVAKGDTLAATKQFEWLAHNNLYFDEGVVAAAGFFEEHGGDKRKTYSILSEALQVNPVSVRILKKYILAALARGYDDYATSALETLQTQISPSAFRLYMAENQLSNLLRQ